MDDSPLDGAALRKAVALLADPARRDGLIGLTAAAAFFAAAALTLVVVVISLPSPWPT